MVLDNADDVEQVLPLLPGSAGCSVLITSRNALPDLPVGARLPLEPLGEGDQRAMLSAFCGADRVLAEDGDATRILAACAGLPLALRIVGAKARVRPSWPLRTIAEQLEAGDGRLRACRRAACPSAPPSPPAIGCCGTAVTATNARRHVPSGCSACGAAMG